MKRCINWFVQWVGKMCWEEKVGFSLGGLVSIIVGIVIYSIACDSTSCLVAFGLALLTGICTFALGGLVFTILVLCIEFLLELSCSKRN